MVGRHQHAQLPAAKERSKRSPLLSPKTAPVAIFQIFCGGSIYSATLSAVILHHVGRVRPKARQSSCVGTLSKPHWKDSESEAQTAVMKCRRSLAQTSRHCEHTSVAIIWHYKVGQSWRHVIVYKMPLPRLRLQHSSIFPTALLNAKPTGSPLLLHILLNNLTTRLPKAYFRTINNGFR